MNNGPIGDAPLGWQSSFRWNLRPYDYSPGWPVTSLAELAPSNHTYVALKSVQFEVPTRIDGYSLRTAAVAFAASTQMTLWLCPLRTGLSDFRPFPGVAISGSAVGITLPTTTYQGVTAALASPLTIWTPGRYLLGMYLSGNTGAGTLECAQFLEPMSSQQGMDCDYAYAPLSQPIYTHGAAFDLSTWNGTSNLVEDTVANGFLAQALVNLFCERVI